MKASMTVEASVVMPFCFLVIAIVCCLGVFQYNQAILKLTGYECMVHSMELREESESLLKENIRKRAEETGKARTLGIQNLEVSVSVTASKISVTYSADQSLLRLPLKVTTVYERVYPELTLRLLSGNTGE